MVLLLLIWVIGSPLLIFIGLIMVCFENSRKSGLKVLLFGLAMLLIGASVCGLMCG